MALSSRSKKSNKVLTRADVEIPCGPCKVDEKYLEAAGFCQFCRHYLCKSCYSYHQNLGKSHTLLNTEMMPRELTTPLPSKDPLIEPCRNHKHKTIELYCKGHDEVCCVICATGKHKQCECFYIPDYTENLTQSPADECSMILKLIQALIGQLENVKSESSKRLKDLDRQKREFIHSVKKYRREIDAFLDDIEKQVLNGMKQVVEINSHELNENINKCEESLKALRETYVNTEKAIESSGKNRIFTLSKTSNKELTDNKAVLKSVSDSSINVDVKFDENFEILRNLRKNKSLGKVSVKKESAKFNGEPLKSTEREKNTGSAKLQKNTTISEERISTE